MSDSLLNETEGKHNRIGGGFAKKAIDENGGSGGFFAMNDNADSFAENGSRLCPCTCVVGYGMRSGAPDVELYTFKTA